jgi:hypothetical protein
VRNHVITASENLAGLLGDLEIVGATSAVADRTENGDGDAFADRLRFPECKVKRTKVPDLAS